MPVAAQDDRGRRQVRIDDLDMTGRSWRFPIALAAVAVLFALSVSALTVHLASAVESDQLPRLELPDVAGQQGADAKARLEKLGFAVTLKTAAAEGRPAGVVIEQQPEARAKVLQGDVVVVVVSDGLTGVPLANFVGRQIADMQAVLAASNTPVLVTQVASETIGVGEVMSQSPPGGKRLAAGTPVKVDVSSGPAPRTVPDLVNKDINEVMLALGRGGFGIGDITEVSDPALPNGRVTAVDPAPGTQVPRDFPVKLTVVRPPPMISVPYVVGVSQAAGDAALRAVGLVPGFRTVTVPAGDPTDGKVVAQSVPGGAPVPAGTAVFISIASSGTPPAPPVAPTVPTTAPPPPPVPPGTVPPPAPAAPAVPVPGQ
jgi:serine/threonine-protein kinase